MTRLVAVDPGIRGCGLSMFEVAGADGVAGLRWAGYVKNPCGVGDSPMACMEMARALREALQIQGWCLYDDKPVHFEVALEWPQVYREGQRAAKGDGPGAQNKDPNNLLPLVGVGMAFVALTQKPCTAYRPAEWKGQVKKGAAFDDRVYSRLSEAERAAIVDAGSLTHNVVDAVGLGLHHLGRFVKRRVIAR